MVHVARIVLVLRDDVALLAGDRVLERSTVEVNLMRADADRGRGLRSIDALGRRRVLQAPVAAPAAALERRWRVVRFASRGQRNESEQTEPRAASPTHHLLSRLLGRLMKFSSAAFVRAAPTKGVQRLSARLALEVLGARG
jgi:hypothetical protein